MSSLALPSLDLLLPGDPRTRTGGYLYDRRIIDGLDRLGWTTRVLSLPGDFPGASRASVRAAEAVLAAIPAGRIVVIDGLALADLFAALEPHASRLRLIALVHHPLGDETGLDGETAARLRRDERRAWAQARGIIVTSEWTRRRLARDGVPGERVRVVQPGTDPHAPAPDRSDSAPPRLLCVATLTARKGHALLLDALARIADRPWRLDCVGSTTRDPATAAEVHARIERHALGERVVLHGETSRAALDACYAAARAFVLPSYLEGYGMAFADALANGLPIIGTAAGAIPETVGDAGLLVSPGDVGALAEAIARILGDDGLHAELAARARARARALPTWAEASRRFAAAAAALAGAAVDEPANTSARH